MKGIEQFTETSKEIAEIMTLAYKNASNDASRAQDSRSDNARSATNAETLEQEMRIGHH